MAGNQLEGLGQFTLNLFKGLQAIGKLDENFHLFTFDTFSEKAQRLFPEARIVPIAAMGDFHNLNKYHRFLKSLYIDQYLVPHFLKKDRYDLLFHPFNAANDHMSHKVPTLITIHDLYFRNFPGNHNRKYLIYLKYRYEDLIHNSKHIIVPSQFVKQDILKYYPHADPEKITVINNPVLIDYNKIAEFPVEKPYLLCVNSIRRHKNIITLLKAFQLIEDQIDHYLVLTGAITSDGIDPAQYAAQNKIKKLIVTGYVSDEQRNYLYQNADIFISPSLHEGFGMTPVEAALFAIPVLAARTTSIPEITRNMVNYYEPADDPHALAAQILKLIKNTPSPTELLHIKNTLTREYDFEKIAALYFDAFAMTGRSN
ncbi:MAG TPA: glycosyltransferase family 1 protein [Syntrophomonadaceae bacterium]|nr:glycosyltransferase family 1 protein [Syntrophomonadaceae bacterium]HPR92787.1 glycosyltransferase family 1 protein [Syntrophomonadaceae bacterium]